VTVRPNQAMQSPGHRVPVAVVVSGSLGRQPWADHNNWRMSWSHWCPRGEHGWFEHLPWISNALIVFARLRSMRSGRA
jgi:hypothetical protein